jgi:hypothetical protein
MQQLFDWMAAGVGASYREVTSIAILPAQFIIITRCACAKFMHAARAH